MVTSVVFHPNKIRGVAVAAAALTVIVGITVLLGWVIDAQKLKSVIPGLASMKVNTALSFILVGTSILKRLLNKRSEKHGRLPIVLALGASLIGLATMAEYAVGRTLGIDQLLFHDTEKYGVPGRMGMNTAINFIALGTAIAILHGSSRRWHSTAQWLLVLPFAISLTAIVGYLYSVTYLYQVASHTQMALHTALAFLVICASSLLLRPETGFVSILLGDTSGGTMARIMLPASVIVPITIGLIRLMWKDYFPVEISVSILTLAHIAVFTAVIGISLNTVHHADLNRKMALADLRNSQDNLEIRVIERTEELSQITAKLQSEIIERRRFEEERDRFFSLSADLLCITSVDGYFKRLNPAFETTLGYTLLELMSRPYIEFVHPDDVADALAQAAALKSDVPIRQFQNRYRCKDGSYRWLFWRCVPFANEGLQYATARDITEDRLIQEKLKSSLSEKEMLLREIHHRVKNNLQIVSSLLQLQANAIHDPQVAQLFNESQNRVKSMGLLHESLYQGKSLASVDFKQYVQGLVNHLIQSYGRQSARIRVSQMVQNVNLDIDTAIPCGLIINELLTNSLKHAYPAGGDGKIDINFVQTDKANQYLLHIADYGIGFPETFDLKHSSSLGMKLVYGLAKQIRGTLEREIVTSGTSFSLKFEVVANS